MTAGRRSSATRLAAVAGALLLAADLAGCSSRAGAAGSAAHTCIAVPNDVLAQIEVGARPGAPLTIETASAVKARKGVFVVAGRFPGDKGAAVVGVWTVVAMHGRAAPILAADVNSSAYSTWSSVEELPQFGVPLLSPTIAAARDCLHG